jgi:D-aspartate ligase
MRNDLDNLTQALERDRPPVVLLGGINLVRTLGEAGIPAVVALSDEEDPAFDSRYCTAAIDLPPLDRPAAAEALLALGRRLASHYGRRVPLMFGSDDALDLVSRQRRRLERYFLFLVNDDEVAVSLIAKDRFQSFGWKRGLPLPRALDPRSGELAAFPGQVLVKPKLKFDWHNTGLCQLLFDGGEGKALVMPSGREAASHPEIAAHAEQLLFQEYIAGDDAELWSFHGFADARGQVLAGFVGRKVRTFPPLTGESAFVTLDEDAALEALGREVARKCPLKGFFKMDFKRDAASGRWLLLEINARCSLWQYVGAMSGLNLMEVAYHYLLDANPPTDLAPTRRYSWVNMRLDWRAYRALAKGGQLSFPAWIASLLSTRKVYSLWGWRDPMPFVRHWTQRITRKLLRPANRLARRFAWRSTAS